MRYLKLFESFEDIIMIPSSREAKIHEINEICYRYGIKNYTINPDESIDVNGDVDLFNKGLTKLPLKFNKVNRDFYCNNNKLTSLEGCPKEVNRYFDCVVNKLTSFEFAPKIIRGNFECQCNNINSFEYFPSYVKEGFYCKGNPIEEVWELFYDWTKIELLNDFDIFRDEDTDTPSILMNRLNDFLEMIGKPTVEKVDLYKNI